MTHVIDVGHIAPVDVEEFVHQILAVANETLDRPALFDRLVELATAQESRVRLAVPVRIPTYADAGLPPLTVATIELASGPLERDAEERLSAALVELGRRGVKATGRVYCSDPMTAVDNEMAEERADAVLISTKPRALSRWLGLDLPSRVARRHGVPVHLLEHQPATVAG